MRLLKFHATWCQPCKALTNRMIELTGADTIGYPMVAIDIDEDPSMAAKYQVRSVPTLVLIDSEGFVIQRKSGMPALNELKELMGV